MKKNIWKKALCLLLAALLLAGCQAAASPEDPASQAPEASQGEAMFHFDPAQVTYITLDSGSSGTSQTLATRGQVLAMVELLNGFTFTRTEEEPPATGWSYGFTVHTDLWSESYTFSPSWVEVPKEDGGSTLYYGPEGYWQELADIIDGRQWLNLCLGFDPEETETVAAGVYGDQVPVEDPAAREEVLALFNNFTYRAVEDSVPDDEYFYWLSLTGGQGGADLCFGSYFVRLMSPEGEYRYYCGEADYFTPLIQWAEEEAEKAAPTPEAEPPATESPQPTTTPPPPREGALFQLDPEKLLAVRIRREHPRAQLVELTEPEKLEWAGELLNGFAYTSTGSFPEDALRYTLTVETEGEDGYPAYTSVTLGPNAVEEDVPNTSSGTRTYLCADEDYFQPLLDYADEAVPAGTDPLFQLEAGDYEGIRFRGQGGNAFVLTDREEMETVVERLNAFTFSREEEVPPTTYSQEEHSVVLLPEADNFALGDFLTLVEDGAELSVGGAQHWYWGEEGYFAPILQWEEEAWFALPYGFDAAQVTEIFLHGPDSQRLLLTKPQEIEKAVELINGFSPTGSQTLEAGDFGDLPYFFRLTVETEKGTLYVQTDFSENQLALESPEGGYVLHTGAAGHFAPLIGLLENSVPL